LIVGRFKRPASHFMQSDLWNDTKVVEWSVPVVDIELTFG